MTSQDKQPDDQFQPCGECGLPMALPSFVEMIKIEQQFRLDYPDGVPDDDEVVTICNFCRDELAVTWGEPEELDDDA